MSKLITKNMMKSIKLVIDWKNQINLGYHIKSNQNWVSERFRKNVEWVKDSGSNWVKYSVWLSLSEMRKTEKGFLSSKEDIEYMR